MADAIGARIWLARSDAGGSEFCLLVPERYLGAEPGDEGSGEGGAAQSITARV
jgi:hypothetical protein